MYPVDFNWTSAKQTVEQARAIPGAPDSKRDRSAAMLNSVGLDETSPLHVHSLMIQVGDLHELVEIIARVSHLIYDSRLVPADDDKLQLAMAQAWAAVAVNIGVVADRHATRLADAPIGVSSDYTRYVPPSYGFDPAAAKWDALRSVSSPSQRMFPEAYDRIERCLFEAHTASGTVPVPTVDQLGLWPYCRVAAIQLMLGEQEVILHNVGASPALLDQADTIGELILLAGWESVPEQRRRVDV